MGSKNNDISSHSNFSMGSSEGSFQMSLNSCVLKSEKSINASRKNQHFSISSDFPETEKHIAKKKKQKNEKDKVDLDQLRQKFTDENNIDKS